MLAAILAASVVVDLVFFTGFIASDDVLYLTAGRKLAETGTLWRDPTTHGTRLLMIGWCALVGMCVRHDVQAIAASFVVFHQTLNVLTYVLGRQLLGRGTGLLAAALSASCPLLVVFSTTILPDIPLTVCLVAALLVFRAADDGAGRTRGGFVVLSGALVGLASLAKEPGLIAAPFFLVLSVVRRPEDRGDRLVIGGALARAAAFLGGLGLVLGLEAAALRALTGAWFFRLGVLVDGQAEGAPFLAGFAHRAAQLADTLGVHAVPSAAAVGVAALAFVYAGRRPGLRSILFFPAWYAAYYTWGSARLTTYYSPSLQPRYFIPCLPFLLVAVAALLWAVYGQASARTHGRGAGLLRAACVLAGAAVVVWQLRRCDAQAGTMYGAPLASQSLRALRSWTSSGRGPIVISDSLGADLFPLLRDHRERLLFSHEVGPADLERWRHTGGFGFLDLHPASPLRRAALNPLIGWRQGVPASARHAERLVEALLEGRTAESPWTLRPAGRFDRVGPRSAELRALLGDPAGLPHLRPQPERAVLLYEVVASEQDVRYPLPPFEAAQAPVVVNGALEDWTGAGPRGWLARDTPVSRGQGPEGTAAVRLGPGEFGYLWQSLTASPALRGREVLLQARVRTDTPGAARLWIRVGAGSDWEEAFGTPHRGDGTWRWMEAAVPVSLQFSGGEVRIVLLHGGAGHSEFDDVAVAVR